MAKVVQIKTSFQIVVKARLHHDVEARKKGPASVMSCGQAREEGEKNVRIRPPLVALARRLLLLSSPVDPASRVPLLRKDRVTLVRDDLELRVLRRLRRSLDRCLLLLRREVLNKER